MIKDTEIKETQNETERQRSFIDVYKRQILQWQWQSLLSETKR